MLVFVCGGRGVAGSLDVISQHQLFWVGIEVQLSREIFDAVFTDIKS